MNVKDVMNPNVIHISPKDKVSAALRLMQKHQINNIPVCEKEYVGMLSLRYLLRKIDPDITKVNTYVKNPPKLSLGNSIERATALLLNSDFTALPVLEKNRLVGILSEMDLLKHIDINQPVKKFVTECITENKDLPIGRVKNLLEEHNISRIPLTENGKIISIVDLFSFIKYLKEAEEQGARGLSKEDGGEKIREDEIPAINFGRSFINVEGNKKINEIIPLLEKNEEVIVDGRCIITPKDILEIAAVEKEEGETEKETIIQTANLDVDDEIIESQVKKKLYNFAQKYDKIIKGPKYLFLHVEKTNKGGKTRYELRIRYSTDKKLYVARSQGWNLLAVVDDLLEKLEKELD